MEARRDSELFGERRLQRIIAQNTEANANDLAEIIMDEVRRFSGDHLGDDIAIVVIKRSD